MNLQDLLQFKHQFDLNLQMFSTTTNFMQIYSTEPLIPMLEMSQFLAHKLKLQQKVCHI